MKLSARGGRRSAAQHVVEQMRTADRFPPGDPRREAAQRRVARAVAADPSLAEHPALAGMRAQLRRWSRFAPYLLPDADEAALAATNRALVSSQLSLLGSLEADLSTSLATADQALRGLDAGSVELRRAADAAAHACTDRRAPMAAAVLGALAKCHLDDDRQRGIDDWRTRFAFVQGTTPATLARLRDATLAACGSAGQWWQARAVVVGGEYCDRRVGLDSPPVALDTHAAMAAEALAAAVPQLADGARSAAARIRPGVDNQVVIEADGRISATVAHRPTPRGSLMVAHEIGHALHAVESRSPEPPGALVGETVACWASLVAGRRYLADASSRPAASAAALALGDTLVEELFVSAAVSAFEDAIYRITQSGVAVTVDALDDAWITAHRELLGVAVPVPGQIGSGWARLPSLATDPGHAFSYVWATVLAAAIVGRCGGTDTGVVAAAIRAGGIEADEFTALLGFDGDEWIEEGLAMLAAELARLGQLLGSSTSPDTSPAG